MMPELSVENFVRLATSERLVICICLYLNFARYVTPAHESYDQLEQIYWSYDTIDKADDPIYGADVQESLIGGVELLKILI